MAEAESRREAGLRGATKPEARGVLFHYAWELKKQGLKESTIRTYVRYLSTLKKRGANFLTQNLLRT